jgi:hypothetical protein
VFDYDELIEDAMRGVVQNVLKRVATDGATGEHCFFITFRTDHPLVEMPFYLMDEHPTEMTIVLQHRFWGLAVSEDAFEVTLSFSNVHERLHIPFDAMMMFEDRSEKLSLHFEPRLNGVVKAPTPVQQATVVAQAKDILKQPAGDVDDETADEGKTEGNVISMDAFRRK